MCVCGRIKTERKKNSKIKGTLKKIYIRSVVWPKDDSDKLLWALSPSWNIRQTKTYTPGFTKTHIAQKEKEEEKKKISPTLRLVVARGLCKFNQYFPHGLRNPLSYWPQTKRSKSQSDRQKERISFTSWLRTESSLITLGWAFSTVSISRAAFVVQGQTDTFRTRKTGYHLRQKKNIHKLSVHLFKDYPFVPKGFICTLLCKRPPPALKDFYTNLSI